MAKTRGRPPGSGRKSEGKLIDFAADLGRLLGTTERKANEWFGQGKVLSGQLSAIRDHADKLLHRLTGGAAEMAVAVGVARGSRKNKKTAVKASRKRKPMTAAQKKAVGIRMKKYWAERRKADGKQ